MTPTKALDELSDRAPFVLAAPAGDADADGALVEYPEGVDDVLDDPALFRAWVMSIGIMYGLPFELPRLTVPSSDMTSGFEAKKLRVYLNRQHQRQE
jgi:hypothetical protein